MFQNYPCAFAFDGSSIISSPILPAALLELLAATTRARGVTPDVLEHLLPFGFRNTLFSRLNHGSDFFTELLRQFLKCWTIEERRAFGWIVIPPLGNPPVGVISDLVFRFDLTVLQQFGRFKPLGIVTTRLIFVHFSSSFNLIAMSSFLL